MAKFTFNSQKFTMTLGVVLVFFHVCMVLMLLYLFGIDGRVNATQISVPITVAYLTAIVKWFCDTKGIVTSDEVVGLSFVIISTLVVVGMMIGLVGAVYVYMCVDRSMTPTQLESVFVFIEGAFGGVFGLIISTLFKIDKSTD